MSPSVLKPTWPLKKFSFSKTPTLIKRDIVCLFSSKARAEKRAEEERHSARLEMKPCASSTPAQEQAPQTHVCSPTAPKAIAPHSASKDTSTPRQTVDSGSSPNTPPSTAATSVVSITHLPATYLPTTYGAAMAYFELWFKAQHPNIMIPPSERNVFRGVVVVLYIVLLKCFKDATYSPLIGFRPDEFRLPYNPRVLELILAGLTDDRQDAQQLAESFLSITDSHSLGPICPRDFLSRIGVAKMRITEAESQLLHKGFERLLGHNGELC
ncbi:hypothetical protein PMIN06_003296 [Paraphaeosphaeria minitans]|uniref:Uncharacterized protein n=1 Tax=Paraphaeosphaeria minitans TaxID=565426 RepID=A0A9P6KJT1_9PLEO|nr:hypothetical protein PMIN01_12772 [Paraphaeosphaeria minitans]